MSLHFYYSCSFSRALSTMAESTNQAINGEEEDYMGDLSQFLPPEASDPPKPLPKKVSNYKTLAVESSKKRPKTLNWQEQRKLERERKQREEDEQTLANIEAPIPQSNIGFRLLKQMGYTPGAALGKEGSGRAEPVGIQIRRSRAGIGREDPQKEKMKKEEIRADKKRENVETLMEEFGSRQKSQWRSKRILVHYKKAKAALDQLENKEVVEPKKNEDEDEDEDEDEEAEEEGEQEEDEEEEITEEDLQDILMKLREEYRYCLFCGCQYESMEALLSNCPGTDEDDH